MGGSSPPLSRHSALDIFCSSKRLLCFLKHNGVWWSKWWSALELARGSYLLCHSISYGLSKLNRRMRGTIYCCMTILYFVDTTEACHVHESHSVWIHTTLQGSHHNIYGESCSTLLCLSSHPDVNRLSQRNVECIRVEMSFHWAQLRLYFTYVLCHCTTSCGCRTLYVSVIVES